MAAAPVDLKQASALRQLVRRAGLKLDSNAGKALEADVVELRDAYARNKAFLRENAKRRLKPLRDIAKHAAVVAKGLDRMKAFQALVEAIADVVRRDDFFRRNAPEFAPDDLDKLCGGPLGPTAISFGLLPQSLRRFAEQAESVLELRAAPARRRGRRAGETRMRQRVAHRLRSALRKRAPRVESGCPNERKWLAEALDFCGCEHPAWHSWRFGKFLLAGEPDPKSDHIKPPRK